MVSEVRIALAQSRPCLSDLGSRRGLLEQAGQKGIRCCPGAGQPCGEGGGWPRPRQRGRSRGKRGGHPGKRSWDRRWDSRAVRSRRTPKQGEGIARGWSLPCAFIHYPSEEADSICTGERAAAGCAGLGGNGLTSLPPSPLCRSQSRKLTLS